MAWEAWLTLLLIGFMAVALLRNWAGADTVMLGGLTILMTLGLVSDKFPSAEHLIEGFGSEGPVTIGVLFVVAAGLTQTGAMSLLATPLLGRPKSVPSAQLRMMPPVAALSAFLNNTPIVAMFIPVVQDWCRKYNLNPSKLFIPLSYAAILGGACSLIGTSTNVIIYGMMDESQKQDFGMFTIAWVGVPAAIVGVIYVLVLSPWLLRGKGEDDAGGEEKARDYSLELLVEPGGPIAGKTIERAGLRALPGVFLSAIDRGGERMPLVGPQQVLRDNDRLIFVGQVDSMGDLQKIRGLVPAEDQVFKLKDPRPDRVLVEAVVSGQAEFLHKTVREASFRTEYNGVIIAVHRNGRHLNQKIGDLVLQPGDTLLIETHPRFVDQNRHRRDFYLISAIEGTTPLRHDRAWIALAILLGVVFLASTKILPLVNAALLGGGLMVMTGCCSPSDARRAIEWRPLLTIGAAIGIALALETTGAAVGIGDAVISLASPMGAIGVLAGVYIMTCLFNMMVGHAGAAALAFPIAAAIAADQNMNFTPLAVALMLGASLEFSVPVSYPTHLMVFNAGGYRFADYVRFGLALNIIVMIVFLIIAPQIWPLTI